MKKMAIFNFSPQNFNVFSFQMSNLLKEHQFNGFCNILKISGQPMNNPDRKVIEKAFRKLALKTHPDKVMNFYLFLNLLKRY